MDFIIGLGIGAILVALIYVAYAICARSPSIFTGYDVETKAAITRICKLAYETTELAAKTKARLNSESNKPEAVNRATDAQRERDAVFNRLWNLPGCLQLDEYNTVYVIRQAGGDFEEVTVFVNSVKIVRYVNVDPDGTCANGARVFRPDVWASLWPWLRDYDTPVRGPKGSPGRYPSATIQSAMW